MDEFIEVRQPSFAVTYGPGASVVSVIGINEAWRWTALARFGPHFPAKFLARTLGCPWEAITALEGDFNAPTRAVMAQVHDPYRRQYQNAVARIESEAVALFASIRAQFDQIKNIGDRTAFAEAVQQIPDTAVQQAMYLLRDGQDLKAELRAWAAVRPTPMRLFRIPGTEGLTELADLT